MHFKTQKYMLILKKTEKGPQLLLLLQEMHNMFLHWKFIIYWVYFKFRCIWYRIENINTLYISIKLTIYAKVPGIPYTCDYSILVNDWSHSSMI